MGASSTLTTAEKASLILISGAGTAILANTFEADGGPLTASLALSMLGFAATYALIRWLGPTFVARNIKGVDMSKTNKTPIPEAMGAVCAVVFLFIMIVFIPFAFYKDIVAATSGGGNRDVVLKAEHVNEGRLLHRFPHNKLASFLSAIISVYSTTLLGIGDDLFDIRWLHKFFIPGVAAIPLLMVYFVDFGVTSIVVPIPLQPYLGELVNLGALYYVFMAGLAIFTPQSINILAGINGIEVSQSIVIATLLISNDLLYLGTEYPHPATESHLLSLFFLLPFMGVSLALLCHNWYPSKVFVGDTYCYFAGMVFTVVSVLGHFSKTLALLLLPQIFNFIYSMPQIAHIVPCPRHRLPQFNERTGLLQPSMTIWSAEKQPHPVFVAPVLRLLGKLHLLKVVTVVAVAEAGAGAGAAAAAEDSKKKTKKNSNGAAAADEGKEEGLVFLETSNFTILNLWLVLRGPMSEQRLAMEVTALQFTVGVVGLVVRHQLALFIFKEDNLGQLVPTTAAAAGGSV